MSGRSDLHADTDDAPAAARKPRALIVTLYGLYAREVGGWLSVAAVIRLLARCGVDAPSARSAIHRLKRRGLLTAAKVDGVAGYALSDEASRILREGDRRIFERRRATPGEGWLLAIFTVPEAQRDRRHQLRSHLGGLGFGTVAAGVWIAPARLFDETHDVLERHGLAGYVNLFRAHYLAFADVASQVARWWDLAALAERHFEFLDRHGPALAALAADDDIEPAEAFPAYVSALTDWRRLPYADPGLPVQALPADWPGVRAAETFFALHDRLAKPAHRFVDLTLREI